MILHGHLRPAGLLLCLTLLPTASAGAAEEAVFPLKEVSPFQVESKDCELTLWRGQLERCKSERDEKAKAYPKLKSSRPLYGEAVFGRRNYYDTSTGLHCLFVLDEPGGTGKGYDLLYVDVNGDGDLTNDGVLRPMKHPPKGVIPERWKTKQLVCFDYLTLPIDFSPKLGKRPIRLIPRFCEGESGYVSICFVATTAWQGKIRIGSQDYFATLGQPYLITGRFDCPYTAIDLRPLTAGRARDRWGADTLGSMRVVDDVWYCLTASPTGEQLVVQPYRGEFGVLEVGPGGRNLAKLGVGGSLCSASATVPVGKLNEQGWTDKQRQCRVPVGDYFPYGLGITYGRLYISLSNNYHSDGHPRDRQGRPPVYGIKIRKDAPYVLDFSNKPEVLFASPGRDQQFRPGEEISVKGVLIDPVLDIMIRHVDDTTRKADRSFTNSNGETQTYKTHLSLDPTVTIRNSRGERVAEGVMPFG